MKTKIIQAVYDDSESIRPVGKAHEDKNGNLIICPKCNKGITFLEFKSGKDKCTICNYPA